MKVLVTGGLGFIGSTLAENLLQQGHQVLSIDCLDDYYDPNLKLRNLVVLEKSRQFSNRILDLNSTELLRREVAQFCPDVVAHTAGRAGVRPSLADPQAYIGANLAALTSLLEVMRLEKISKLLFCSSSSVYGSRAEVGFTEDLPFDSAISFYAASKQCGEIINRQYHNLYNLSVINARLFTVYGPRQRPDLAIHKFFSAAIARRAITLFGDGSMKRDYTYVGDIVQGMMAAIDRLMAHHQPIYETYNLGNSNPVSLTELVAAIEQVVGRRLIIEHRQVPPGDVPITYADIAAAKSVLGYSPQTDLLTGLNEMYRWMLAQDPQRPKLAVTNVPNPPVVVSANS